MYCSSAEKIMKTHPLSSRLFSTSHLSILLGSILLFLSGGAWAESAVATVDLTHHGLAIGCLMVFIIAYTGVIFEEKIHLKKSKPVLLASGLIWVMISILASHLGMPAESVHEAVMADLEEYAALLMFLMVAMTYVNALEERGVFEALRYWLVGRGFTYRQLFWVTGTLAFFISPIADNLTTALVMGTVIMSVGQNEPRFTIPAMINIVVAANAGGAFSPFGDITTLMVWQAGKVDFFGFFALFLPAVANYVLPALLMTPSIPSKRPDPITTKFKTKTGARIMSGLFLVTIMLAVCFEQLFHLPPFLGMITGMSLLMIYTWILRLRTGGYIARHRAAYNRKYGSLDTFEKISHAEWDTLFFFFGVMFAVGGLSYLGYLQLLSTVMYGELGPFVTNVAAGLASAIIDNIPVMFAILDMQPEMDGFQWLLITLTAGVGGSLLSVGSAAGVALMGVSRGQYTFMSHLRWSWAVMIGFMASIGVHWIVNG